MSVESGFKTFRGNDGLWENYPVEQVASHEGWLKDPTLVTNFYNMLRHKLYAAQPNEGHRLIHDLEKEYKVTVITQNVDNLHEKAGSTDVIHLHGELTKVCSSRNPDDPRYQRELTEDDSRGTSRHTLGRRLAGASVHRLLRRVGAYDKRSSRGCRASRHIRHHRHIAQRLSGSRTHPLRAPLGARISYRSRTVDGRRPPALHPPSVWCKRRNAQVVRNFEEIKNAGMASSPYPHFL